MTTAQVSTERSDSTRQVWGHVLMIAAIVPVLFCAVLVLMASVLFFFNIPVNGRLIPLAFGLTAGALIRLERDRFREAMTGLALGLLLLAAGFTVAWSTYDITWDGLGYHQSVVMKLLDNWVPHTEYVVPDDDRLLRYANWYPNGAWITAAAMIKFSGSHEGGKLMSVVFPLAAFLLLLGVCLGERVSLQLSLLLAAVTVLNPVSICQVMSFMVDGQLAALLVMLGTCAWVALKRQDRTAWWGAMGALLLLVNLKFTGAVMGMLVLTVVTGMVYVQRRRFPERFFFRTAFWTVFLAVFVAGFNPYVTNLAMHGSPVHPIAGPEKFDVIKWQRPLNIEGQNRFAALVISLSSVSDGPRRVHLEASRRKDPFSVEAGEFDAFIQSGLTVGGFGPLFGAIVMVSVLLLIVALMMRDTRDPPLLVAILGLLVSVLIHPDAWWARLAPQLWLFPVLAALLFVRARRWMVKLPGLLLLLALLVNAGGVAISQVGQHMAVERRIEYQLNRLKDRKLVVYTGLFKSVAVRLSAAGIAFTTVPRSTMLPCRISGASGLDNGSVLSTEGSGGRGNGGRTVNRHTITRLLTG